MIVGVFKLLQDIKINLRVVFSEKLNINTNPKPYSRPRICLMSNILKAKFGKRTHEEGQDSPRDGCRDRK